MHKKSLEANFVVEIKRLVSANDFSVFKLACLSHYQLVFFHKRLTDEIDMGC